MAFGKSYKNVIQSHLTCRIFQRNPLRLYLQNAKKAFIKDDWTICFKTVSETLSDIQQNMVKKTEIRRETKNKMTLFLVEIMNIHTRNHYKR